MAECESAQPARPWRHVSNGAYGDGVRVTAATVNAGGDLLGQVEYLGGLTCPNLGPWLSAEATFFNASGLVVATSSDSETSPVVGVRYPLRIFGGSGAVPRGARRVR
jgi:hypothetical protein